MIQLRITTNAGAVARALKGFFRDQVPFALSVGINETAKDAQAAQIGGMAQRFTIRRQSWVNRAIKIKPFSTKRSLTATIQVEPQGGGGRADILTRHEERGQRQGQVGGGRSLAVPLEARRSKRDLVRKRDRPKSFSFERVQTRGPNEIFRGNRRTFMVRAPDGSGWILRRVGPGESGRLFEGTKVLFRLKPETRIPGDLRFVATITATVAQRFELNFSRAFDHAVRTPR